MFTSITWGEYLFYNVLILFVYYTMVAVLYYKWELLSLAGIKRIDTSTKLLTTSGIKDQFITKNQDDASILISLETELHALFTNSSEIITATELLHLTSKILQKYPGKVIDIHQKDIKHFIATETNIYFPGLINQNDVEQLWFG